MFDCWGGYRGEGRWRWGHRCFWSGRTSSDQSKHEEADDRQSECGPVTHSFLLLAGRGTRQNRPAVVDRIQLYYTTESKERIVLARSQLCRMRLRRWRAPAYAGSEGRGASPWRANQASRASAATKREPVKQMRSLRARLRQGQVQGLGYRLADLRMEAQRDRLFLKLERGRGTRMARLGDDGPLDPG